MSISEWIGNSLSFLYNLLIHFVRYSEGSEPQQLEERIREESRENDVQSGRTPNTGGAEDTVDFRLASDLEKSLEKVSEAIYRKCIVDWHRPPETLQNQPLYKEINSGLQTIFINIENRARLLEEYEIIISVTNSLIAHFKNKKKKNVTYRFKNRQEEVDFVRRHTERLLDYWLSEPMKSSRPLYVFLTEILTVNVLEQTINKVSEPTYINDTIVQFLDENPAAQQTNVFVRCMMIQDRRCSPEDESNMITESMDPPGTSTGAETQGTVEKKKKGLGKRLKDFFKRNKPRTTKSKSVPAFRSLKHDGDVVDTDACDYNGGSDDDGEDSDDDYEDGKMSTISIIDTTLQMWKQNNWNAKVSECLVEKEIEYEISVYDESTPDTVLWNTKRRVEDFKLIYKEICQKYPLDFITFTNSDTTGGPKSDDGPFFHSIGRTPDQFINILLDLIKIDQYKIAVFFFSPFDYEDVRELLKCLPNSEEEQSSEPSTTEDESSGDSSNSGMDSDNPKIAFSSFYGGNDDEQSSEDADTKSLSSNLLDRTEQVNKKFPKNVPSPNNLDSTNLNPQKLSQKYLDMVDQNIAQTIEQQKEKLQETVLVVIYQLIDEVLAGGVVSWLHRIGAMKQYSKKILNYIPGIYVEEQIIWYLNQLADLLMSEERPQELTPSELQEKALDVLKNALRGFVNNFLVKILFKKKILKNLKASHQALQDPLANKETLYGILEDLTKVITNDLH
ncbi:uncharacterized protein ACNLHF_000628 [Anomaloglossus baeobatrachus]|uniref:uncharacterized protein LOC142250494 n=1 Tax=Anomaloglossus baeobatrachus TaxID=238106 RepID=UPI003F50805A